jgi:hypothetical protein
MTFFIVFLVFIGRIYRIRPEKEPADPFCTLV